VQEAWDWAGCAGCAGGIGGNGHNCAGGQVVCTLVMVEMQLILGVAGILDV